MNENETNNQVPMEPTEQAPQTPPIPEAAPATEVTAQTEVDTSKANEVTVINTQKEKKGGSLALIILLGLLVLFVFNIDYVISLYDSIFNKTVVTKKPTGNNDSNNLFNGFILIGEESYAITDNIKFYSFKKSSGILNFKYNSTEKNASVGDLNIYIELYNVNKEILYKEKFSITEADKDVAKSYSIYLDPDIDSSVYYAKLVKYTDADINSIQTVTCTKSETETIPAADAESEPVNKVTKYTNVFNFKSQELVSVMVSVEGTQEDLDKIASSLPEGFKVTNANGKLSYTDVLAENSTFKVKKGDIITVVKNKQVNESWNCN